MGRSEQIYREEKACELNGNWVELRNKNVLKLGFWNRKSTVFKGFRFCKISVLVMLFIEKISQLALVVGEREEDEEIGFVWTWNI